MIPYVSLSEFSVPHSPTTYRTASWRCGYHAPGELHNLACACCMSVRVCMFAYMYVRYVCTCVCVCAWLFCVCIRLDGWLDARTDGRMYGCMDVWMYMYTRAPLSETFKCCAVRKGDGDMLAGSALFTTLMCCRCNK